MRKSALLFCATAVLVTPRSLTPCEGVTIRPGSEIQSVVATHGPGTTYCIEPGLYRLAQTIVPKKEDKLIGSPGAVLNGAKIITEWVRSGSLWKATGQTQRSPLSWKPTWPPIGDPTAQYDEDLFLDGRQLKRVLSVPEVGSGKFYFDYDAATIYIGDDPKGRTVECSVTPNAIESSAGDITVKGLTVEKFTQRGISLNRNSTIENNEVRYVHGAGIRFGSGVKVLNNHTHHNGKYGMNGGGEDSLVEGNEIAFNNTAGYHNVKGGCWDAGATKFSHSTRLTVRNNYSHNNYCDGFWSDTDNIDTVYENNRIEDNYRNGIFIEISYAVTIRNNSISGNMGTGIWINSSSDLDIYGNTIKNNGVGEPDNGVAVPDFGRGGIIMVQQKRGTGRYGEYLSKNIKVHDNTIVMTAGANGATSVGARHQSDAQSESALGGCCRHYTDSV